MSYKTFGQNDDQVVNYAIATFKPEDDVLIEIRQRLVNEGLPEIQVGPMDGLHLEVLTRAIGARKAVEVGTLGGYSGVCIARGLPEDGKLYTFEINEKNAEVARESFKRAGVAHKVEVVVGAAALNLARYNKQGPFDLVFIDADKPTYPYYIKWAAENLRIGGVVLGDNTFAWGTIGDPKIENSDEKPSVMALREFNLFAAQSGRFRSTVLPTGEGLTMGVKIK